MKQKDVLTASADIDSNQYANTFVGCPNENPISSLDSKVSTNNYSAQTSGSNSKDSSDICSETPDTGNIKQANEGTSVLVGGLFCGAFPALLVGLGAICYHTGYRDGARETRPTIVQGDQHHTKIYNIAPSIGSNNSNNSNNTQKP